jgi:hypothetical protein
MFSGSGNPLFTTALSYVSSFRHAPGPANPPSQPADSSASARMLAFPEAAFELWMGLTEAPDGKTQKL